MGCADPVPQVREHNTRYKGKRLQEVSAPAKVTRKDTSARGPRAVERTLQDESEDDSEGENDLEEECWVRAVRNNPPPSPTALQRPADAPLFSQDPALRFKTASKTRKPRQIGGLEDGLP